MSTANEKEQLLALWEVDPRQALLKARWQQHLEEDRAHAEEWQSMVMALAGRKRAELRDILSLTCRQSPEYLEALERRRLRNQLQLTYALGLARNEGAGHALELLAQQSWQFDQEFVAEYTDEYFTYYCNACDNCTDQLRCPCLCALSKLDDGITFDDFLTGRQCGTCGMEDHATFICPMRFVQLGEELRTTAHRVFEHMKCGWVALAIAEEAAQLDGKNHDFVQGLFAVCFPQCTVQEVLGMFAKIMEYEALIKRLARKVITRDCNFTGILKGFTQAFRSKFIKRVQGCLDKPIVSLNCYDIYNAFLDTRDRMEWLVKYRSTKFQQCGHCHEYGHSIGICPTKDWEADAAAEAAAAEATAAEATADTENQD